MKNENSFMYTRGLTNLLHRKSQVHLEELSMIVSEEVFRNLFEMTRDQLCWSPVVLGSHYQQI